MKNEIPALLFKLTAALAGFLTNVLPRLDENWWEQSVANVLSDYQRQRIERQNITSLSALDIAALLRVFNNKWYAIAMELNLTREDRHYVKEMQSIQNRWAHSNANGFSFDISQTVVVDIVFTQARIDNDGDWFGKGENYFKVWTGRRSEEHTSELQSH